jgi:hypothetical protein
LENIAASVIVELHYDEGDGMYIANARRTGTAEAITEERAATPGDAATRVWGAAIARLKQDAGAEPST